MRVVRAPGSTITSLTRTRRHTTSRDMLFCNTSCDGAQSPAESAQRATASASHEPSQAIAAISALESPTRTRKPAASATAHIAHAALISLHTLCCALPLVAVLATSIIGAGAVGLARESSAIHALIHGHEGLILALSAMLVAVGAVLEWRLFQRSARAGLRRGAPWLFMISVVCLTFNLVFTLAHRF